MDTPVEEFAAEVAHEVNRVYCKHIGDPIPPTWDLEDPKIKKGTILGATNAINGVTPEESHNGWMRVRINDGWKYGTTKDVMRKIHPDLVPYKELPESQKAKNSLFIAVVNAAFRAALSN